MRKCVLNYSWTKPHAWAKPTSDKYKAFCVAEWKGSRRRKMGESAQKSHVKLLKAINTINMYVIFFIVDA